MLLVDFIKSEDGLVTTDWVFMAASTMATGVAVTDVQIGGVENLAYEIAGVEFDDVNSRYDTFGFSNEQVIEVTEWESRSVAAQLSLYQAYLNRSESNLRNTHRNWSNRASDPTYSNPERARDIVAVAEMALEERGISPHTGYEF